MGTLIGFVGIVALLAAGSEGARSLDGEKPAALSYWQSVLPNTPIPNALKELIPSRQTAHTLQVTHKAEAKATGPVDDNIAGGEMKVDQVSEDAARKIDDQAASKDAARNILLYHSNDVTTSEDAARKIDDQAASKDAARNILLYHSNDLTTSEDAARKIDDQAASKDAAGNILLYHSNDLTTSEDAARKIDDQAASKDAARNILLYHSNDLTTSEDAARNTALKVDDQAASEDAARNILIYHSNDLTTSEDAARNILLYHNWRGVDDKNGADENASINGGRAGKTKRDIFHATN